MNHWLWSVSFSADDSTLAVRSAPEQVTVYNLNENTRQCNFEELGLNLARLSHDGAWIACVTAASVAEDPGRVSLGFRDACSGEKIAQVQERNLTALEFAPEEALLAVGAERGEVAVWQPGKADPLWRVSVDTAPITALRFSRANATAPEQETLLAALSSGGTVWMGGLRTGAELVRFKASGGRAGALALSPDGKLLAVGASQYVYVYETSSGAQVYRLEGHEKEVLQVAFSPDGELLYSVTATDIKLWKVAVPGAAGTLKGAGLLCGAVLSGGTLLRTISKEGNLQEWGLHSGVAESTARPVSAAFDQALLNPTGTRLLLESTEGLTIYGIEENKILTEIPRLHLQATPVAFSPDGRRLAVLAADALSQTALLSVYNLADGAAVCIIRIYRRTESWDLTYAALAFSRDGDTLAFAAFNRLTLYSIPEGREQEVYTIPILQQERMNQACFSDQGDKIAVTLQADSLYVLDRTEEQNSLQINTAGNRIVSIAFNKDGSRMAVGDDEGVVNLWNTVAGVQLTYEPVLGGEVRYVCFTPDGRTLLAGDGEQVALLRAFPWSEEDLPGNACTLLDTRLEAVKTYQESSMPAWGRCQRRMHDLENAILEAGGVSEAVMERVKTATCPAGGVYSLAEGSAAPVCSLHGRLHNAAHLLERVSQYESDPGHANPLLKECLVRALPETCISLGDLACQWHQQKNCHEEVILMACDQGLQSCPDDPGLAAGKMALLLDRDQWDEALRLLPNVEGKAHRYPGLEPRLALGLAKRGNEEDIRAVCRMLMQYYGNHRENEFPPEAVDLLRQSPYWATMKEARLVEKFLAMNKEDWKKLPWRDSLDAALEEAKTRDCLVFVNIAIPDSGALRSLRETIFSNPNIAERLTQHFALVQVDATEQPEISDRLGVSDLPALVVLDADGKILRRENCNFSDMGFSFEFLDGFDAPTRLNDWCILGLFGPDGCPEVEAAAKSGNLDFSQTWPGKEGQVQWRAYTCPPVFPHVTLPNLYVWTPHSVAYACASFELAEEKTIEPEFYLLEGGKIWIDGIVVAKKKDRIRKLIVSRPTLKLGPGRHHVFVKVAARYDGAFRIDLLRDRTMPLEGLAACPLPDDLPLLSVTQRVGEQGTTENLPEGGEAPNTIHLTVNKKDILRQWREHYGEILEALNPQPFFENGKIVGIRAENPEKIALLASHGFKNGDIVTSVNGYAFGGEKNVLEIAELTEGSNPYTIKIKRGDEEFTYVVHVE